jgi:hypothetical protein
VGGVNTSRSRRETTLTHVLNASQQHRHWIGTSWVPPSPSWRLYDPAEMLRAYDGKSSLFMGDSTSQRLAQTLFSLLGEETENGLKSNPLTLSRYQQASNDSAITRCNHHLSQATLNETTEVCPFMEETAIFEHNGTISSLNANSAQAMTNKTLLSQWFPYDSGFCHRTLAFPRQPTEVAKRSPLLL